MINVGKILSNISDQAQKRSPELCAGFAITGVIISIITTYKQAPKIQRDLDMARDELEDCDRISDEYKREIKIQCAKDLARDGFPIVVSGGMTIGFIVLSNYISNRRQALLAGLLSTTQTALLDYQNAANEVIDDKHRQRIHDRIAERKVEENPPNPDYIQKTGEGTTLCLETITGQYFYSDIHRIKTKWIEFNEDLRVDVEKPLNDWLDELKIQRSDIGDDLVWVYDPEKNLRHVEMRETSALAADSTPVFCIGYDRPPTYAR